jgi:hypothetical protein
MRNKLWGVRTKDYLCAVVSSRYGCGTGGPGSSLARKLANGAYRVSTWNRVPLRQQRRHLAFSVCKGDLACVVMQVQNEREMQLSQDGRRNEDSA